MSNVSNKKYKEICPFGMALANLRKSKNISSGRLSMKGETFPSHLHKIEKGIALPSITVAIRLVSVLESEVSNFFKELAVSEHLILDKSSLIFDNNILIFLTNYAKSKNTSEIKSLFGFLFREFRILHKVTQQKVSEFTEYSIRNIQKVEAGTQDPNVMTALKMLCSISHIKNVDIDVFFNAYQQILKELSEK